MNTEVLRKLIRSLNCEILCARETIAVKRHVPFLASSNLCFTKVSSTLFPSSSEENVPFTDKDTTYNGKDTGLYIETEAIK